MFDTGIQHYKVPLPAAVTVGLQVHRDGTDVLGRVLRCLGFPGFEALPHPSARALRFRFHLAGRRVELL